MSDLVKCPICDKEFKVISSPHLAIKHGISTEEFKKMYPGYPLSGDAFKRKMSAVNTENMRREEARSKISKANKEFYSTEEGKRKRSEQMRKVWSDEDYKKKRIAHVVERRMELGGNLRQSEKMKRFWKDISNK